MRAVKEIEHSILLNYVGLENKYYLAVSVLTFFGFDDPSRMLSEQDMWPFVSNELGAEAILDSGMPKPGGEVLVNGYCYAPLGKPASALTATFRVGEIAKELYVYGNRYWKRSAGMVAAHTETEPFTRVKISWENAFGGRDFPKNPLGKGIHLVQTRSDELVVPLPNIEYPDRLVGSPDDRPEPAGFGPIDMMWPQRARKQGAYDDKWFRERWPYYPDDMDWTFFNIAPEDQQMDRYFKGDETLAVVNMHAKKPYIESRLPGLRHRCFVNQLDDFKNPKGSTSFKEVKTHPETVWLFPHAERGIVIHRGMTLIADDEGRDVQHLYVATEPLEETPRAIEYYYEDFEKKQDRTVEVDPAPAAEAREALAEAKMQLTDLPLQIKDSVARGLGQAPKPHSTPQKLIADAQALIDNNSQILDRGAAQAAEAKAKFGHLMKIEPDKFVETKETLQAAKGRLAVLDQKIRTAMAKVKQTRAVAQDKVRALKDQVLPEHLEGAGLDLDAFAESLDPKPDKLWHQSGMMFIEQCRDDLMSSPEIHGALGNLGFRPYHIKRAWLGINTEERQFDPADWGLEPSESENPGPADLIIPAGFVIPKFIGADLVRITVRPGAHLPEAWKDGSWADPSRDVLVEGSSEEAMTHLAHQGGPFVRVRDELESLLLNQDLDGLCSVAALRKPSDGPEDEVAGQMAEAPQFLAVMYPEAETAEDTKIGPWVDAIPQAEALPIPEGRNLFEARQAKVDLRRWVMDALKPGLKPVVEEAEEEGHEASAIFRKLNIPVMIDEVRAALMSTVQPKLDELEATKKKVLDQAGKRLEEIGRDPGELLKPIERPGEDPNPFKAMLKKQDEIFAGAKESVKGNSPELVEAEAKLADLEVKTKSLLEKSAAQYDEGMAKLEAAKAQAKQGLPEWARNLLAGAGLDPDDPQPLRTLTREEVIERYENEQSLAGKVLGGVDLSNLDLSGADLKGAQLDKANLAGCNLAGADLSKALGEEADFTGACLKGAALGGGLFIGAKFGQDDLSGADLSQAILSQADFTEADLTEANLEKALLEEAKLTKARLHRAKAGLGIFISTDAAEADLSEADTSQAFFMEANLDQADFSRGNHQKTTFHSVTGNKAKFTGSDLRNARIGGESVIHKGDFTNVRADKLCFMDSDLTGSDFQGSRMNGGMVEGCNLSQTNLDRVSAKKTHFNRSDLTGASLRGTNLFEASIRKVGLAWADISLANLYGAECFKLRMGKTKMEGTNIKNTLLEKIKDYLPK